jgi:aspartate kinase
VALAAALDATCEIYSDVDGVYTSDPRVVPEARRLAEVSYEEMQELAESGAKVLNAQAVEFAKEKGIAIYARATRGGAGETVIRKFPPRAPGRVVGVASETGIVALGCAGGPERLAALLEALDARGASGKQLLYHAGADGGGVSSLVLPLENVHEYAALRDELRARLGAALRIREGIGAVSAIGAGINATFANLRRGLAAMDALGATPVGASTSSFRISFLVEERHVPEAVRRLHKELVTEGEPTRSPAE